VLEEETTGWSQRMSDALAELNAKKAMLEAREMSRKGYVKIWHQWPRSSPRSPYDGIDTSKILNRRARLPTAHVTPPWLCAVGVRAFTKLLSQT
jgi:hypothetical protein